MTKEHLGLALALNVPVFVVVTKIEICHANILQGESLRTRGSYLQIKYLITIDNHSLLSLLPG